MKLTTIKSLVAAALCAVGLSSFAAEPEAVQLWEGGPYWATCNVGADTPEGYGILTNFNDAAQAVTDALGEGWRLPTKAEFEALLANCGKGTWTEQNGAKGRLFTGTGDYSSNSIFLPAAGFDYGNGREYAGGEGDYWSSEEYGDYNARILFFNKEFFYVGNCVRGYGLPVRAVRDTPLVTGPTVKVDSVETGDPWSKVTVNYTLGGVDAATDYKVAFDVTAGGVTKGVTNAAAKVENGATNAVIDTAALFGAATPDTKAKVKVSLIALKPKAAGGVQLWEGGPYWAECNIGADTPEDYGILTNYNDAAQAVTDALGEGWRLPTKAEFEKLDGEISGFCTKTWDDTKKGYTFTGVTEDYKDKSIFLPAAGVGSGGGRSDAGGRGHYWSSTERFASLMWYLFFRASEVYVSYGLDRLCGLSVRAVQDPSAKPEPVATAEAEVVAFAEAEFWLGPTEIEVSLTTGTGYGYAVSNLTLMAEIAPSAAGGTTYLLPIGAKIGIYCVAEANYDVVGTNPYVIDEVDFDMTIDAGELPTAEVMLGTERCPWEIGEGVTAYVKDRVLYLLGEGEVDEFADGAPWAEYDDLLTGIGPLSRAITIPASVAATLPVSVEGSGPSGAISGAEFEAVQIIDGKAYLDVSVYTSDTITNQNWSVATNGVIEVPAPGKQGFFILQSKAGEMK